MLRVRRRRKGFGKKRFYRDQDPSALFSALSWLFELFPMWAMAHYRNLKNCLPVLAGT
jgi:hypothetical protein